MKAIVTEGHRVGLEYIREWDDAERVERFRVEIAPKLRAFDSDPYAEGLLAAADECGESHPDGAKLLRATVLKVRSE